LCFERIVWVCIDAYLALVLDLYVGDLARRERTSSMNSRPLSVLLISWLTLIAPQTAHADVLLKNENPNVVSSNPTGGNPKFTLSKLTTVDSIYTYHYNQGKGQSAGQIWVVGGPNNLKYGPWAATVVSKFYWNVAPKINLPPGTYTVFDSDPKTWSHNAGSNNQGFAQVLGTLVDLNTLQLFDDVKGKVASLATADRKQVLDTLDDDRKGPVKAYLGIVPTPTAACNKTSISAAKGETATLRVNNAFAGHRYNAILATPGGGTISWQFRDGVVDIPAAYIVNGYPLKSAKTLTLTIQDSSVPNGWSSFTQVGTITLTVSP
jgi:hypothetical protein